MQYDFDEIIDRRGTGALKYEALLPRWGRDDLIPLWVADMDFKTPPFIMEAIRRRCEHEILGYTVKPRAFFDAIRNWVGRRHGWEVRASEIAWTLTTCGRPCAAAACSSCATPTTPAAACGARRNCAAWRKSARKAARWSSLTKSMRT